MMVTKNPQNVHRKCFWTILVTFIFDVKIDINMCEPHYVNLSFVNLLHSLCVWLFDIWHLFDILTSFWHFDIFLTIWHIAYNLNHLIPSQGYLFYRYHMWPSSLAVANRFWPVSSRSSWVTWVHFLQGLAEYYCWLMLMSKGGGSFKCCFLYYHAQTCWAWAWWAWAPCFWGISPEILNIFLSSLDTNYI